MADWDIPDWVGSRSTTRRPEAWVGDHGVTHRLSAKGLSVVRRDVREFGAAYRMIDNSQTTNTA